MVVLCSAIIAEAGYDMENNTGLLKEVSPLPEETHPMIHCTD